MTDDVERSNQPIGDPQAEGQRGSSPVGTPEGITGYDDIGVSTGQSEARGDLPSTAMYNILQGMIDLTRSQNPFVDYHYHSNVAIGETEELMYHEVPPNQNAGGWIPLRNGFFTGVTIQITDPNALPAGEGIRFSMYRNNEEVPALIYVSDAHNKVDDAAAALGAIRIIEFNTVPSGYDSQTNIDTFHFKAGEEITVRTNTVILSTGLTFNAAVKGIHFAVYYVFDITTPETLAARRFGGGNPGDVPGGGGGGSGDGGHIPT